VTTPEDSTILSIVIPAYNENDRLGNSLDRILSYVKGRHIPFEMIVVDDGSKDETVRVAREKLSGVSHQVIENGVNRGKGFSVRRGVQAAKGKYVLFTDADLSTPIEEIEKLMPYLEKGYDLAIGSRGVQSSQVEVHQNVLRETMGRTFNVIAHAVAFRGIKDSQCGFKLFKNEAAQSLFEHQKIDGFCFDAEVIFLAQKMGYRIAEVGVRWMNSPQSKVRILGDSLRMLIDLVRIRLLHMC